MARHDFRIRKAEGQDAKGILACLQAAFERHRAQLWVSKIQNLSEWWRPSPIVTEIVAEKITLGLGNVRETGAVLESGRCGPQKLNPGALHRPKSQLLGERACDIVTDVTET